MASTSGSGDSWGTRLNALVGALKGRGLRSLQAVRLMRKLCEAGDVQLVLEAVAAVLLSESLSSGAVPPNAGVVSKDLGYAVEAAIREIVEAYHLDGNPLTTRHVTTDELVAEMCKQWARGFAPPIADTLSIRGTLSDPEIQDRLTVVALRLRELIIEKTDPLGGEAEPTGYHLDAETLEVLCKDAALAMFTAFETPNETNHELIHGRKLNAG